MDGALGGRRRSIASIGRARAPTSSRSIRRRRLSADRCTSDMSSRTRTPTSSRAFSACAARPCSIRWGGTTTACRPSGACRITSACAAIRRCPTIPSFVPPEKPGKQPIPVSRPNFIELCARLTAEDEKVFEQLWRHLGLSVDWSMTYATIDRRSQRVSQLSFLRLLRPRTSRISSRRRRCGTSTSGRRWRRPSSRIANSPARTTASGLRKPIGDAFLEIDTTRPELIPACVALVAHPDDERYQAAVRHDVDHAAVRRACAGSPACAGRS